MYKEFIALIESDKEMTKYRSKFSSFQSLIADDGNKKGKSSQGDSMTSKQANEIVNVKSNQENAPSAPFEETQVRVKRFSKDVPTFSGKMNESFDNWSWDIRQCIRIEQMNDREAALAITTKLKGAPHNLYRDYIENCVSFNKTESYAEFHQQLKHKMNKTHQNKT